MSSRSAFVLLCFSIWLIACDSSLTVGPKEPRLREYDAAVAEAEHMDGGVSPSLVQEPETGDASCVPATCDALAIDCGYAADGCGGLVDCGGCGEDALCGVVEHNTCTPKSELCTPLDSKQACDGVGCGLVGDGCGGVIDCGGCADGESCGLFEPYSCGEVPVNNEETCSSGVTSCEEAGVECGLVGNGCGGVLDCDAEVGGCGAGEYCGLGGPGRCGAPEQCEPLSFADACEGKCGIVSNGCGVEVDGGLIDCSEDAQHACGAGEACGAGGVTNQCGDSEGTCTPSSQSDACSAIECGVISDGCDGSYSCGGCSADATCVSGVCQPFCKPLTVSQACLDKQCGVVSDGCGGSLDCGSCAAGEACGQFDAFQCEPIPAASCVPQTPAQACDGRECGIVFDGCGIDQANSIDCSAVNGGCASGELCGVGQAYRCDTPGSVACVEATSCGELGWECGMAVDECGNVFDCASEGFSCNSASETCMGGISSPAQCVTGWEVLAQGDCEVCGGIPSCFGQAQPTRITGRVITPGLNDADASNQIGVPNAFVYILQTNDEGLLPDIPTGIPQEGGGYISACDRCEDQDLGPVLISTTTDSSGGFVLEGSVPVDQDFLLVVKTGKWRRAERIHLDPSAACQTTTLSEVQTRLPRSVSDGIGAHIPKIAVSTGRVDAIECVLYKLGVDQNEFNQPGSSGTAPERVHMYRADSFGGASMFDGSTSHTALHADLDRMFSYDMLIFDCQGTEVEHTTDANIREFVNHGGRMFASHWSYTWLHDNGSLSYADAVSGGNPYDTGMEAAATWELSYGNESLDTGYVSIGRPGANATKVQAFADWLVNEGSATLESNGDYSLSIADPRDLAINVGPASEEYVYRYSSDPALGGGDFCKPCTELQRENCITNESCDWNEGAATCSPSNDCEAKSKAACDADPTCTWNGVSCDFSEDCDSGNVDIDDKQSCFDRSECGWDVTAVQQFSFNTPYAAPAADICGRVAYSGFHVVAEPGSDYTTAVFPEHCTGALSSQEKVLVYMLFDLGACVSDEDPLPPECVPLTQAACDGRCSVIGDGCGGTLDCAGCAADEVCHPGGICGPPDCVPTSCAAQGATCGSIADGCGGVLDCGECEVGQECGLLVPNQCTPTCSPIDEATACQQGACGYASNGCDAVYDCGGCAGGLTCIDQQCVDAQCTPMSECPVSAECGTISDGCSGTLDCGGCSLPEVCGAAGDANQCGVTACEPLNCTDLDAQCGWIGDGCGGSLFCGDCEAGSICGAAGPNQCGGCVPLTCDAVGAECGAIGDGCGGVVECGDCAEGESCGGQQANQCSTDLQCTPLSCADRGAECGLAGDGCGGSLDCGSCGADEICGVQEPFRCGPAPSCQQLTCDDLGAECGAIGDGCGGLIDCGSCPVGRTPCGRDYPNRCPEATRGPF